MGLRGLLGLSGGGRHHGGAWRHHGGGWWGPNQYGPPMWAWGAYPWYTAGAYAYPQIPDPVTQQQAQQALQTSRQALVTAEAAQAEAEPAWKRVPWWVWLAIAGGAYMVLRPKRAVTNRRRRRAR